MNNQRQHWDNLHSAGDLDGFSRGPTSFALEVSSLLPKRARILELGAGFGNDASYFAAAGHDVTGGDFSSVAIQKAQKAAAGIDNLGFVALDIGEAYPYPDGRFDLVYARLSLHYFPDALTRKIFREIRRVLKPNGLLCFLCKSTDDRLYGQGDQIEPDMYELRGHVRHFFSEEYARSCLKGLFEIASIDAGREDFYARQSSFVKVIARAIE